MKMRRMMEKAGKGNNKAVCVNASAIICQHESIIAPQISQGSLFRGFLAIKDDVGFDKL